MWQDSSWCNLNYQNRLWSHTSFRLKKNVRLSFGFLFQAELTHVKEYLLFDWDFSMSIFHFQCNNTKEALKLWHSVMPRIEGKSFSVETKEKSVENDSSGLLKISFAGSCWAQLHRGWHSLTSAASPSSPGANPVPDDMEGGVLQPWRMVIITTATLWETRNPPNSAFLWNWGLQLNLPCTPATGRAPQNSLQQTNWPCSPSTPVSRSSALNSSANSTWRTGESL